jgi:hypothetical protein
MSEIITKVTIDTSASVNNIEALTTSIEENKQSQRDLNKELKSLGDRTEENALQYDALSEELAVNRSITQDMNSERRRSIKNLEVEKGSLADLKMQLREAGQERENVNLTTAEGSAEAERLDAVMLGLTDTIGGHEQASGNFTRSVGNYATAFDGATESVASMNPAAGKAVQGIKGMGTAFKAMLANPVVLVIAGIVLVFQSMVSWMQRTEEGQEELASITAKLSSYFETFMDVVSALGKYVFSVFVPIVKLLITNFTALFHATVGVFQAMSFQFEEAGKSFGKSADAIVESVDNIKDGFNAATDNFSTMTSEMSKAGQGMEEVSQKAQQLAHDQAELNKAIRENTVVEGQRKLAIAEQVLISRDQTKSIAERMAAVEKANELELDVMENKKAILEEELRIAEVADSLHDSTLEDKQAVADAERKLLDFQTMSIGRQRELLNRKITLQNEEASANKKIADDQKKADDKQKAIDEEKKAEDQAKKDQDAIDAEEKRLKEINDLNALNDFKALQRANALEDEQAQADAMIEIEKTKLARLLENQALSDSERELLLLESEQRQVEIQKNADDQVAANDKAHKAEAKKDDEKTASDRQKNTQIYLQSSEQLYSLLSQHANKHSVGMKVLGVANATVNTFVAANAALAQTTGGIGVKLAAFGIAIATGLGAVASIIGTNASTDGTDSGGGPAPSVDTGGGGSVDTSQVDNQISQEEALQGAFESVNFQVSVNEINDAQDQVSVVESETTF